MPVTTNWKDQTDDWSAALNWDNGVPGAGDTARLLAGDKVIANGLDQSAIGTLNIITGVNWKGGLGTPGNPLRTGATTLVQINSPRSRGIVLWPTSLTTLKVNGINSGMYGLHLQAGTVTSLHAAAAGLLRIGASAVVTNLRASSDSGMDTDLMIRIDGGAAITNAYLNGGYVECDAAIITLLKLLRGRWLHRGLTYGNVPLLEMFGASYFEFSAKNAVIADARVFGGFFDCTKDAMGRTVTASEVWTGGTIDATDSNVIFTGNIKRYGGTVKGTDAITSFLDTGGGGRM